MVKIARGVSAILLSVLFSCALKAQIITSGEFEFRRPGEFGTIHSPKNFGVYFCLPGPDDSYDTISLMADMYGVISGRYSSPGVKFSYNHSIVLRNWEINSWNINMYAGPGLSLGYLRDSDRARGGMAGINLAGGLKTHMQRNIDIGVEFCSDIAFYISENPRYHNLQLSMYKLGISRVFYPQLKISYKL